MMGLCIITGMANGMYLTMDTSLAVDTLDVDVATVSEMVIPRKYSIENGLDQEHDKSNSNNRHNDHGTAQVSLQA